VYLLVDCQLILLLPQLSQVCSLTETDRQTDRQTRDRRGRRAGEVGTRDGCQACVSLTLNTCVFASIPEQAHTSTSHAGADTLHPRETVLPSLSMPLDSRANELFIDSSILSVATAAVALAVTSEADEADAFRGGGQTRASERGGRCEEKRSGAACVHSDEGKTPLRPLN